MNAISEMISQARDDDEISKRFGLLCQKMRYGLPNEESILIYEIGFSDRFISQHIALNIPLFGRVTKEYIQKVLTSMKPLLSNLLSNYPSYFTNRLEKF